MTASSYLPSLKARRPALFNIYSSCQPEHGIGDDMSEHQARLAVESRAYPLFRYDPDAGKTPQECFDLQGNPAIREDWSKAPDGSPIDFLAFARPGTAASSSPAAPGATSASPDHRPAPSAAGSSLPAQRPGQRARVAPPEPLDVGLDDGS